MGSRIIKSTARVISSEEELVRTVSKMQLSSIEDLCDSATLFKGKLDGREVVLTFDFYDGYGVLTVLRSSRKDT